MKYLAIAIPAYADLKYRTSRMLWRLTSLLTARGIVYDEIPHLGNPDIGLARNSQLAAFMSGRAERLLFVDTDVAADEMAVCDRLVLTPLDYVGANYPRKRLGAGMASTPAFVGDVDGSLLEANLLATGLLSLSRSCVERLRDAAEPFVTALGEQAYAIATPGVVDGRWVGEDEAMCRRWKAIGGKAWIDTSIRCVHVGNMTFTEKTA